VQRTFRPLLLAAASWGVLSCGEYPTVSPDRPPVRFEEIPEQDPDPNVCAWYECRDLLDWERDFLMDRILNHIRRDDAMCYDIAMRMYSKLTQNQIFAAQAPISPTGEPYYTGGWDANTGDVYIRDSYLSFDQPGETTKTTIHEGFHDIYGPTNEYDRQLVEDRALASEDRCISP
jgi:hypothetical protein